MNTLTPDLINRCLHGAASPKEWSALESAVTTDPASAARWVQEVRLHESLRTLHGTTWPLPKVRRWQEVTAAVAGLAAVLAFGLVVFSKPRVPEPDYAQSSPALAPASLPVEEAVTLHGPATADSGDNPATPPHEVRPLVLSNVAVQAKMIALTFDDGPHAANTPRLLDILKAAGAKATFFPLGMNFQKNLDILRRIRKEGHDIGNHTWTHPKLSGLSDEKVSEEIGRAQTAITDITGAPPSFWRPPYGSITDRQKQVILDKFGMTEVLWSIDPEDWKLRNAIKVTESILQLAKPGGIVLLHDIHGTSVDAVPAILASLKAAGYSFVTLTELQSQAKREAQNEAEPKLSPAAVKGPTPDPK